MAKRTTILLNLTLVICSSLIALVLCELVVRLVLPQQLVTANEGIWRPDSTLGWQHQENVDRDVNTGERDARFVSDDLGYRVNGPDEYPTPEDPEFRILALGDSFVEGLMVDSEETAPKVLERMLAENGIRAEVVNSGVSGWNPYHYLLKAERALEREDYDMGIVFLYVANDVISPKDTLIKVAPVARIHPFRIPRSLSKRELTKAILQPTNDYLERHSHLFVLLKHRADHVLAQMGLTKYYFPDLFRRGEAESPRWHFTASIVQRIALEFQRADIPVLFVLVPASYQVNEEVFYRYVRAFSIAEAEVDLGQPNRLLAETIDAQTGAPVLDLLPRLRQADAQGAALYGRVDRHLNEQGHFTVAEFLFPIVRDSLLNVGTDSMLTLVNYEDPAL